MSEQETKNTAPVIEEEETLTDEDLEQVAGGARLRVRTA